MKKLIPLTVLLSIASINVFAQDDLSTKKLKDAQLINMVAPGKVKVDGNLAEWENNFQAFNKSTKLYYTVSNDDKYFYLVVKSTDPNNNTKITSGGITLTINTDGKKKEQDAYSVTFPVIAAPTFGQRGQRGGGGFPGTGGFGGGFGRGNIPDSAALAVARKQIVTSSKEIKVSGFKDITDSLISIYNEHSIKTAISYETANNYSYEVAIPIKLLGLSMDNPKEFAYNVKVNGRQIPNFNRERIEAAGGGPGGAGGFGGGAPGRGGAGGGGQRGGFTPGGRGPGGNIDIAELTTPSDFWGKYTLAKK